MSSGPSTSMSCSRGPSPGSAGTRDRVAGLGLQRAQHRHREVAGDVAGLHVPLQADEDPAVRLGHRRPGHRQHGGQGDRAVAVPLDHLGREWSAARTRPGPARAGRSTPPRRRGPRRGGARRCRGPSAAWVPLGGGGDRAFFRRLLTARQPRARPGRTGSAGPNRCVDQGRNAPIENSERRIGDQRNLDRPAIGGPGTGSVVDSSAQTLWPSPSRSTPHRSASAARSSGRGRRAPPGPADVR